MSEVNAKWLLILHSTWTIFSQSVQFHITRWIVTPFFGEVILYYFYDMDMAHCFYWIRASCMKWNTYELYNTKQHIRSVLKVPSHKKKIRNFSSQGIKITSCAWIVKTYTDPLFFLNGEWTKISHWHWWTHFAVRNLI